MMNFRDDPFLLYCDVLRRQRMRAWGRPAGERDHLDRRRASEKRAQMEPAEFTEKYFVTPIPFLTMEGMVTGPASAEFERMLDAFPSEPKATDP